MKTFELIAPATTLGTFDGETAAHAIVAYHRAAGLRSVVGADGEVQHDPRDIESGAVVPSETAALRAVEVPYAGAEITVDVGRDTIDPQGLGSDEQCAACEEHILDAVRAAFPGATVRPVSRGGRTSGTTRDGVTLDTEVHAVVTAAFDTFEWPAEAPADGAEVECAYCGATHTPPAEVPARGDDAAWTALAKEHGTSCEWIATRAHTVEVVRVFLDGAESEDWANRAFYTLRDSGVWVRDGVDGCTSWEECSGTEDGEEYVTMRVEGIAVAAETLSEHGYRVTAD